MCFDTFAAPGHSGRRCLISQCQLPKLAPRLSPRHRGQPCALVESTPSPKPFGAIRRARRKAQLVENDCGRTLIRLVPRSVAIEADQRVFQHYSHGIIDHAMLPEWSSWRCVGL